MDTDFIIEDDIDGKIYVLDSYSWDRTFFCVDDIYSFFDALIPVIEVFWRQILGETISDDEKDSISKKCAYKASINNSSNCYSFYRLLNG